MSSQPTERAETFQAGGNSIAYLKAGSGPAVLIVHGIGGRKEDWRGLMRRLQPAHTVYAIDMLGFGGSSKDAAEITVRMQADALRALLDREGLAKASVVGNSVGGWVAATFASAYPTRIVRLVLVDPAGFKAMFEGPSPVNFYPATAEEMQKLLGFVRFDEQARTRDTAARALAALDASGEKAAAERVFKGLFASPRLEDVAAGIGAPTLVLWGAEDRLFPPALADLVASKVQGAKKQLIARAGHFPQLDNPTDFEAAVVEFLN